jgi:hypothetical protein
VFSPVALSATWTRATKTSLSNSKRYGQTTGGPSLFLRSGKPRDNANNIQKYGAEKLEALFTAARKLNKMIGENVVSEDLMVTVIRGGTMFDGERMEDAYARAGVETCPACCDLHHGLGALREEADERSWEDVVKTQGCPP